MLDLNAIFVDTLIKANDLFKYDFSTLKLVIDDMPIAKNTLAFYRPSTKTVHMNKVIMNTLDDETLKNILIHEIAHHVTKIVCPNRKQEHGPEFKKIDRMLGGLGQTKIDLKDNRDAFMTQSSTRKSTTFTYVCGCDTHQISKIRHNKILKGSKYSCGKCKQLIKQA